MFLETKILVSKLGAKKFPSNKIDCFKVDINR